MLRHDYPTDEQLQFIRDYDLMLEPPTSMIKHLQKIWHWPEKSFRQGGTPTGTYLELHTGGWSGNEDIIEALEPTVFWLMFWQKSERGGHYYFEIPGVKDGT